MARRCNHLADTFLVNEAICNPQIIPRFATNESVLITIEDTSSMQSEAFRSVRTALSFATSVKSQKVIAVSSALKGEGKSTISANLAVTIADDNKRVLLIDTDLRSPIIHELFKVPNDLGITNCLVDQKSISQVITPSGHGGLDLITCGPIPPNPAELLGADKIKSTLKSLRKKYDKIILDCPPILPVTDTALIGRIVDKILLVIRAGKTPAPAIKQSVELLESTGVGILGAVLNEITPGMASYHYQYYGYGYSSSLNNAVASNTGSLKGKMKKMLGI